MNKDRLNAIVEEINEVESLDELLALLAEGGEYADAALTPYFDRAKKRFTVKTEPTMPRIEPSSEIQQLELLVAELATQLQALKGDSQAPRKSVRTTTRVAATYRLLKTDVTWSTKPQVHAVMAILAAHMEVGATASETDIVNMMIANEDVLCTRQGGKRIWDYYKGDHNNGLVAHGNVEKL